MVFARTLSFSAETKKNIQNNSTTEIISIKYTKSRLICSYFINMFSNRGKIFFQICSRKKLNINKGLYYPHYFMSDIHVTANDTVGNLHKLCDSVGSHPETNTAIQIENEVEGEREAFEEVPDAIKLEHREEVAKALHEISKQNWSEETDKTEGVVGLISNKCYRTRRFNDSNIPILPSIAMLEPKPKIQEEKSNFKQQIKIEFTNFQLKGEKKLIHWEGIKTNVPSSTSIYGMGENCGGLLLNEMASHKSFEHTNKYDRSRKHVFDPSDSVYPRPRNSSICWNTDACFYDESYESLYQSHPWVLLVHEDGSSNGIFIDSTYRTIIHLRKEENDQIGIYFLTECEKSPPCVYLFSSESPVEIIQELCRLTGYMELPPKWALGYQQCRYSYFPDSVVFDIASTFREKNIPCDVIWIDIHYMDKYKCFTFDPSRFPNPKELNDKLHKRKYLFLNFPMISCQRKVKISNMNFCSN